MPHNKSTPAWLVPLIKANFVNEDGLLSRTYPPSTRTIFDNFDDVVPFLLHFGEADFLLDQTRRLDEHSFEKLLPIGNILYAYKIDEYLGGLNAIYRATGDKHTKRLLIDASHKCLHYFFGSNDHFAEFYDFRTETASPHFSPWSAGLLETFLEITDIVPELDGVTERVMRRWLSHTYTQNTGLFPFRASFKVGAEMLSTLSARLGLWCGEVPVIPDYGQTPKDLGLKAALKRNPIIYGLRRALYAIGSGHWSQLMKSNTTPAFTLIALFAKTNDECWKDPLKRWVSAVRAHMVKPDGVHGHYRPNGQSSRSSLVDGFIFMDVLCDMFFHVEQDFSLLDTAAEIGETCLKWRWDNGLIPMTPDAPHDHLDGQLDFSIALRRVGELAQRADLMDASRTLMKIAFDLHYTQEGLCTHVNARGEPIQLPLNTIDPKYNGLALKGMIHLETFEQSMYGNSTLMDLFKDR